MQQVEELMIPAGVFIETVDMPMAQFKKVRVTMDPSVLDLNRVEQVASVLKRIAVSLPLMYTLPRKPPDP